jgi:hypothetical protein
LRPSVNLGKCIHRDPNQTGDGMDKRPTTSLGISNRAKLESTPTSKRTPKTSLGVWIESDGSFVVAFTADVDMHLRELCALLDAPDRVIVLQIRYTYQRLLDLTHSVVAILGSVEGLSNWGPDTKANKVYIEVLPERIDEVRRVFKETHPDDVYVAPGTPVRPM